MSLDVLRAVMSGFAALAMPGDHIIVFAVGEIITHNKKRLV